MSECMVTGKECIEWSSGHGCTQPDAGMNCIGDLLGDTRAEIVELKEENERIRGANRRLGDGALANQERIEGLDAELAALTARLARIDAAVEAMEGAGVDLSAETEPGTVSLYGKRAAVVCIGKDDSDGVGVGPLLVALANACAEAEVEEDGNDA